MISVENEIFDRVSTSVRERFPNVNMTGEYVKVPSSFPHVSLEEKDNSALTSTQTSTEYENHAVLMYEVNVYSNKTKGKKTECREIISIVDNEMQNLGFTRTMLQPIPNMDDATIYRLTARYTAIISKEKMIYRR
jgi:hypothetical protein